MYARVIMAQVPPAQSTPERTAENIRMFRERMVPAVRRQPGFRGIYLLVDRESGKGGSVSLWETAENARALDAAVAAERAEAVRSTGISSTPVAEYYEVAVEERGDGSSGEGAIARLLTVPGTPELVEATLRQAEQAIAAVRGMPGFRRNLLMVDRKAGKSLNLSLWESAEALRANDAAMAKLREEGFQKIAYTGTPTVEVYEVAVQV
jgi:heme-degrading monooxygenase HmoA